MHLRTTPSATWGDVRHAACTTTGRAWTRDRSQSHDVALERDRRGCTTFVRRPFALSTEGPVSDAYRGDIEHRAEVEGQPGTSWVISAACVDKHDFGALSQCPRGR